MTDMQYNIASALWQLKDTLRQQVIPLLEQNTVNSARIIKLLEKQNENLVDSSVR